jgi:hypothetical protein
MDPLLNPFRPGAGTPPPILAGRQAELDAVANLLGRLAAGRGERSIVLTGLRGVGKTALLWAAENSAEKQGWISQSIEARAGIDFPAALTERSWVILRQLEHRGVMRKALARLAAAIRRVQVREPASGLEVSIDLESAEPSEATLEADVVELFRTLGTTAREGGTGVLFLLDELQLAEPSALEALCAAMQDVGRRELPLAVVAAGLPPLRGQLLAAKTYAERLFGYRELGPLTEEASTAALVEAARSVEPGLELDPAARELLLAECQGYPYFIQVYGHAAWQVASGPVLAIDGAERAVALGRGELESDLYAGRWERASDRGRAYMRGMARLGEGPVSSGEVAAALGGHSAIGPARERLIDDGLIFSPARGLVAFTVPGFANYVRQSPPSASS